MGVIEVAFNRTNNKYYVNYAKVIYSVSYVDNSSDLTSVARIKLDFYVKPDSYTYSLYTKDSLILGVQPDGGNLISYEFPKTESYGDSVNSDVYNFIGSKTFSVSYDSSKSKNVSVSALYKNIATERFSPIYIPKSSSGAYQSYNYINDNANVITLEKRFNMTANTAPKILSVTPTIFTDFIDISFSGAVVGTGNNITDYSIFARTSSDGSSYTSWTNIATISGTSYRYYPEIFGGYSMQIKVKANSGVDDEYSSEFSEIKTVSKNAVPIFANNIKLDKTEYTQGERVTISFDKAIDLDNNLSSYEIEYSLNSGDWIFLKSTTELSYTFIPTMADDLSYIKFRVYAKDILGAKSNYTESNILKRNDYTGLNICKNGVYKKADIYVCGETAFKKAVVYVCSNGEFVKGASI